MKKLWTKKELQSNRGCYSEDQINKLWNGGRGETVTLIEIMESSISIRDKKWFLFNKGEITLQQKKDFALIAAWVVLPIFEEKYPNDKRVRDCLDGIEKFKKGEITKWALLDLRAAATADAYAAAAAADAAAAAAAYAAAAAADAYADAYAAAYAAAAAAAAAYAADAYAAAARVTTYGERLQLALIAFINENESPKKSKEKV